MNRIHSNLWISAQLMGNSVYLPTMVQAACNIVGVDYSESILLTVSTNPAIIDKIVMYEGESIDLCLARVMTDPEDATALDNDIRFLVAQRKVDNG